MFLIDYLYEYSKAVYENKQFAILEDDQFITWAYLTDEMEKPFLDGVDYIFNTQNLTQGSNLWIIDGKINPRRTGFIKAWHREYVPRFDSFKCLLFNKGEQYFREVKLVKGR